MTNNESMISGLTYKDRKIGLAIFGAIQIAMGALCALMVPLMIMGMLVAAVANKDANSAVSVRTMIPGILIYVLMAVCFIWLGIGSIQARRWARALCLVSAWLWFISGITGILFMLMFMPDMYEQMSKDGQMPANVVTVVKYVTFGFMAVIYIIIPGSFILFYGSKNTKATCEHRDPVVRWTDKCPLPVLVMTLMSGCCAACLPFMGLYGWTVPFFGTIVTGVAGAGIALIFLVLLVYITRGLYRLDMKAWWCATGLTVGWGASCTITFSRITLMEFYEKMNFPAQQLEIMRKMSFTQSHSLTYACLFWVIVVLAFLIYTRRYFTSNTPC
ncbi:MAG: hypothetical protein WCJ02_15115 [bacterium]